jgi:polyferredoxin
VIGRINLPWHKHSLFVKSYECKGCLKCINVCEPGALIKNTNNKQVKNSSFEKTKLTFIVNIGLVVFGFAMTISGFLIQIRFHMSHDSVLEIGYYIWSNIHKISIIGISILMTYHFLKHWKWYKMIINKKLVAKNSLQLILSIVFLLVAITGFIPWIIDLSNGSEYLRTSFIEMHDKIALLLFVLLMIHFTKKLKWYRTTLDRLNNKHST